MRERLASYQACTPSVTLTPWSLVEPAAPLPRTSAVRRQLFGPFAKLGLLYSGNLGRAHDHTPFLALARRLRGTGIHVAFGVRGNRAEELAASITPDDSNIHLAPFAPESELESRLGAADVHLVSLSGGWSGVVVPSKFFGALAAGRPVLFAGPADSDVARWIRELKVGWVLDPSSLDALAGELVQLAGSPRRRAELQAHCHRVYQSTFSKSVVVEQWDRLLRGLLPRERRHA
jgi:glycosyltransferase involved in cell wall biosynthesis